jgi:hypothetical protein
VVHVFCWCVFDGGRADCVALDGFMFFWRAGKVERLIGVEVLDGWNGWQGHEDIARAVKAWCDRCVVESEVREVVRVVEVWRERLAG